MHEQAYWKEEGPFQGWRFRELSDVECRGAEFDAFKTSASTTRQAFDGSAVTSAIQTVRADDDAEARRKAAEDEARRKAAEDEARRLAELAAQAARDAEAARLAREAAERAAAAAAAAEARRLAEIAAQAARDAVAAHLAREAAERAAAARGPMFATWDECRNGTQHTLNGRGLGDGGQRGWMLCQLASLRMGRGDPKRNSYLTQREKIRQLRRMRGRGGELDIVATLPRVASEERRDSNQRGELWSAQRRADRQAASSGVQEPVWLSGNSGLRECSGQYSEVAKSSLDDPFLADKVS